MRLFVDWTPEQNCYCVFFTCEKMPADLATEKRTMVHIKFSEEQTIPRGAVTLYIFPERGLRGHPFIGKVRRSRYGFLLLKCSFVLHTEAFSVSSVAGAAILVGRGYSVQGLQFSSWCLRHGRPRWPILFVRDEKTGFWGVG